jgi:HSP20 family protein
MVFNGFWHKPKKQKTMFTTRFTDPINILNVLDSVLDHTIEDNYPVKTNVIESEASLVFNLYLPGVDKSDVSVEVDSGYLTISSKEKLDKQLQEGSKYLLKEFSIPSFKRRFKIPSLVDAETVKASFNSGILSVEFVKVEKRKSNRLIDIL